MSDLVRNLPVSIAPGYRLQWEEAQQTDVILYPEGMVKLNPSAAAILKKCDGKRSIDGVIEALQADFPGVDLAADVLAFFNTADDNGWIRIG